MLFGSNPAPIVDEEALKVVNYKLCPKSYFLGYREKAFRAEDIRNLELKLPIQIEYVEEYD